MTNEAQNAATGTDQTCAVLVNGRQCGAEIEYREPDGSSWPVHSGWYHLDRGIVDHNAVPLSWVR